MMEGDPLPRAWKRGVGAVVLLGLATGALAGAGLWYTRPDLNGGWHSTHGEQWVLRDVGGKVTGTSHIWGLRGFWTVKGVRTGRDVSLAIFNEERAEPAAVFQGRIGRTGRKVVGSLTDRYGRAGHVLERY